MLERKIEPSSAPQLQHLIHQWLKLRQIVLMHYNELCTIQDPYSKTLQVFFQHLMDYISMGHFKIFEKLIEQHEMHPLSENRLDNTWLSNIQQTTDKILDFNDKYTDPKNFGALSKDLSQIGKILAHRMDWEDALIKAIIPAYAFET